MAGRRRVDPADAETTWSRRYGDCKGKTALLLALLHAMGVEAEPVAVSTTFGDGVDARLPMVGLFNHVLVRASVAGRTYWLDGTRTGDTSLDRLTIPNFGWGLPLLAKDAALLRMVPTPLAAPTQDVSIHIDASKGISAPAPATVETIMRGDEAIGANAALANLVGEARDRALKDYWKDQYDFIDVKTARASFDQRAGELRLSMTGEAKLDWANGNYQTDGTNVGYARSGDGSRAESDFNRAKAKASEPVTFNSMCWAKATAGVALESALADCNVALAKAPDVAGYLDSRGLVLLRLGRLDDAIADYNRALAKSPNMPSSLFGRVVAWARKGD